MLRPSETHVQTSHSLIAVTMLLAGMLPPGAVRGADQPSDPATSCRIEVDSVLHAHRFQPGKLLDGDRTDPESRWASSRASGPHWVALRFAEPVAIDRVIVWGHDRPDLALCSAELQIWRDDAWQTLARTADNSRAEVTFNVPPTSTQALRLLLTRPCRRDQTARLFEMALFHRNKPIALRVSDVVIEQPPVERHARHAKRPDLPRVEDDVLPASVRAFPARSVATADAPPASRKLMQAYYASLRDWGKIVIERFRPVPGRPGCGYYGRGGHQENDVRPIAYAALVNAFLAVAQPTSDPPSDAERKLHKDHAIAALRYLTEAHVTGDGSCLNGKAWGDQWQSAMWARSAALAGWMLWDRLDRDVRLAVARLIEHEADRFIRTQPKSSEYNDTGAEENAWNALALSLASNMMPAHPRADAWDRAAKTYLYNSLSVAADHEDDAIGDDGRPIRDWVTTVNAHPDYTVENHGLVHVGYLKTSLGLQLENATHYLCVNGPVPRACLHHAADAFSVLKTCMSWDGAAIYFGGNDWKTVHTQCSDVVIYAMLARLARDPVAARLERTALDMLRRIQRAEDGYYNVRRDLEFGGLCASRLIACTIAHATAETPQEPLRADQLQQRLGGVRHLRYAKAILHRTPTKFASLAWGPKRMALSMPRDGSWVVWPHTASYLGLIDGRDASAKHASLTCIEHTVGEDRFAVWGALDRFGGKVRQTFAFVSPPTDQTIYVERLRLVQGHRLHDRQTGIVGHEYPLGVNDRAIHSEQGVTRVTGVGDDDRVVAIRTRRLNIGDRVGYVIGRLPGRENVVRYHDKKAGTGRVPKLQEWLSLVGDPRGATYEDDVACVVTLLNATAEQTAAFARTVTLHVTATTVSCTVADRRFVFEATTLRPQREGASP